MGGFINFADCTCPDEGQEETLYIDGPLSRSEFDLPNGPLLRLQAYRAAWDKCLSRVKKIIKMSHAPVIDAIISSVQNAYVDSPDKLVLPSSELVTLTVSSSDRIYLHDALAGIISNLCNEYGSASEESLETDGIPGAFVSCLSESHCQSIASLLKALIAGFVSQRIGDNQRRKIKPSVSLVGSDMHLLKAWYQAARNFYGEKMPLLIVLIHDLHNFDQFILKDLLEICSLHVPNLPLIFILGTSDPNHLHSILPRSTLTCLHMERHILPWDNKLLEHVISETFFSPKFTPDVMLGPVGFELIFEEFQRHNATLDAVLSTLQMLHMQHFYNPLSFIVDPSYDKLLYEMLDTSDEWKPFFQLLRRHCIPALITSGKGNDGSQWPKFTPHNVIQTIIDARNAFRTRANRMKVAIHVLDTTLRYLRAHGHKCSGMSFERMSSEVLHGTLGEKEALGVSNLISQLNRDERLALLEELYHLLHSLPSGASENDLKTNVVVAKNLGEEETTIKFGDFLSGYFGQTLISFADIDFLDVWWTGEAFIPHSPLNPNPHMTTVTSLLEPHEYLGWPEVGETGRRRELWSMPDTCILFRRYAESGKIINIYDWYDSFAVALEGEIQDRKGGNGGNAGDIPSKGKGKEVEKATLERKRRERQDTWKREVQARFMRSMHELEFVGFLKHTGRKVDHVVKTVFDIID